MKISQMTPLLWFCGLFVFGGDVLLQNQKNQMTPVVVVVVVVVLLWYGWYGCDFFYR